jgi:D-Tyr-tRNAtyr deacylase
MMRNRPTCPPRRARESRGHASVGEIATGGLLALVFVVREDEAKDIEWMAAKLTSLRIFRDSGGDEAFRPSVGEVGGGILVVQQLYPSPPTPKRDAVRALIAAGGAGGRARDVRRAWSFDAVRATGVCRPRPANSARDMRVSLVQRRPGHLSFVNSRG